MCQPSATLLSPSLTVLTNPMHLKSVFFCIVLSSCVSGWGGAEVTACCWAVDLLQGGKEVADKQRASLVRWFLLGLPWASAAGNAGSRKAPKQNKTCRPFAKSSMCSPKCASCTKWADCVIFMEMLLSRWSVFSAKHWCFHVNMGPPPVLLNKPECVSRLLYIPFCRGPG